MTKKEVYRDLSKPIGALNEERLKTIRFLYQETKSTPFACLYRFHYSTPAYVILFLLRKEPFTTLHIQLQNNKFDHPNRLFYSIAAAWDSVNTNTSDFRELIPESFATPEFLLNTDGYNLGTRFDFVQLKKSLSFGTAADIDKQNVVKSPSLTKVASPSIISQPSQDDSILESDETFTSILNPEQKQQNESEVQSEAQGEAPQVKTETKNEEQKGDGETKSEEQKVDGETKSEEQKGDGEAQSEEQKGDGETKSEAQQTKSEEQKVDGSAAVSNDNLNMKESKAMSTDAFLKSTSNTNAVKASSTSKLSVSTNQNSEDNLESCIAEDNNDLDPANFNDGNEKKQEITIPYMLDGKVNLSKAELGLAYSPSSSNFVGIKIVKTKKGQLVRRDFKVDDIELPLWSPSASAFIAINRLALESDHVSKNLHKWIDLIFGIKQRSEESDNIFHPFSYIQKEPKDPNDLQTLQQHAANFGMVPQCLFSTLHPYRKFRPLSHALQYIEITSKKSPSEMSMFFGVTQIMKFEENVLKIDSSSSSIHGIFENDSTFRTYTITSINNNNNNESETNATVDNVDNNNNNSSNVNLSTKSSFESMENTGNEVQLEFSRSCPIEIPSQLTPQRIFLTTDFTIIISAPWSQSFDTINTKTSKKWSPITNSCHSASVKAIACDQEYGIVVTAAEDSSLFVWDVKKQCKMSTIVAHVDQIVAVAVSSELEIVASCDQRGELVFSSMKTGNFVFKKKLNFQFDALNGSKLAPNKIMLSTLGFVVLMYDCIEEDTSHSTRIILIDLGGRFLGEVKFEGKFTSSIIIKNQDCSEFLVIAQETKLVYILRIFDLKIVCFGPVTDVIKDMTYSKDDLLLYFLTKENELLLSRFSV